LAQAPHTARAELPELPMRHGYHRGIVPAGTARTHGLESILVPACAGVGPGIVDVHLRALLLELAHDVHDLRVPDVGAVLLEGDTEHQHTRPLHMDASLRHQLG